MKNIKKLITAIAILGLIAIINTGIQNKEMGNGYLTLEVAENWAEQNCVSNIDVTFVEQKGYKVSCTQSSYNTANYRQVVMLGISSNPNKPFTIYAINE